ncbi:hypothetical protein FB451DRAFT_1411844 [Mycena latifolia]|nr:hypothetical protein FB451DRAFT_1411844 [Mycena latifolia]
MRERTHRNAHGHPYLNRVGATLARSLWSLNRAIRAGTIQPFLNPRALFPVSSTCRVIFPVLLSVVRHSFLVSAFTYYPFNITFLAVCLYLRLVSRSMTFSRGVSPHSAVSSLRGMTVRLPFPPHVLNFPATLVIDFLADLVHTTRKVFALMHFRRLFFRLRSTPLFSLSRNPYIDDCAAVDHAVEDEASDSGDDDPDATKVQIRHQDERDFQMSDIRRRHQARLVADALYRIPPDLLASGAATARPAQASASGTRTPLFGRDSGAPTTHDPPLFSCGQTSSVFSAPQASSSCKPPLFIPDSRDVTLYSYPGHLTPMSPAPFSPLRPSAPQASSSRNPPLFIPDSRDPTPYSYPGHLTPMSLAPFSPLRPSAPQAFSSHNPPLFIPGSRDATPYTYPGHLTSMSMAPFSRDPTPSMPSAASAQQSRSRGSTPDSSPSAKRLRLEEKGKAGAHAVTQFFDLTASDSEDGAEDDQDDAMELDDADLAFLNDAPLDDDVRPAMWLDADHPDDLRQLAHDYERCAAAGGYDAHESYQAGDNFYDDDEGHNEPDPSLVAAVQSALHEVMPRPRPLPRIFLPVGTWILLQDKRKGRLALVVSMTECVVERQPRQQSMDPCEVITDFTPPLWRRKYAQSLVKPALDALLPFQLRRSSSYGVSSTFLLPLGLGFASKGETEGARHREMPPPVKPRDPNAPFVLEEEEQKQQQQAKKRWRKKNTMTPGECIDPCKIIANVRPFLLKKNYSPIIPSADKLLPFEGSNFVPGDRVIVINVGAGDIIADGCSDDPQITAGTNCWVLDWLDNLAAMNQGEEDKIIGTSAAIWVSTQDPARVPMSLGKRLLGRWLDPPCVRRHAMSPSPALCLLVRVQIRGNEVLIPFPSPPHQVGWVKGIEGNLIFVEPVDGSTTFQAELWQGRQGIIVGAYWGGICQIWETKAASISEVPPQMPSSETFRARVAHVNFAVERAPEAGDYSRCVVSRHPHVPIERAATLPAKESIQLTLAEDEAARRAEREGRMAATEVVPSASLGALRAALERLDAKEESLEHVGKRFEGIRVRVVGAQQPMAKSHFKGKVGMVIGDFDSTERAHRLGAQKLDQRKHIRGDTDSIQVTVKEEITNAQFTVPIDQLVHDATGLPLAQAKYLPNSILFGARQVVAPAPPPRAPTPPHEQPLEDPAWVIDGKSVVNFRLPGETTGEWLCCSAVAKKRVDVVLKGVEGFVRTKKMKSTAALERMEGHIGVLMLDAPITVKSITEHKVDIYRIGPAAGPQEKKEPVPATCLRPLRDNADGTSIIMTRQRVVILGADVDGAEGAVGSYGETQPDVPHDHGEHFVAVKVVFYSMPHIYHVLRLCRSMNQAVYCPMGDYPATVF